MGVYAGDKALTSEEREELRETILKDRGPGPGGMSRKNCERRKLTRREWREVTSNKPPVVLRFKPPGDAAKGIIRKLSEASVMRGVAC